MRLVLNECEMLRWAIVAHDLFSLLKSRFAEDDVIGYWPSTVGFRVLIYGCGISAVVRFSIVGAIRASVNH